MNGTDQAGNANQMTEQDEKTGLLKSFIEPFKDFYGISLISQPVSDGAGMVETRLDATSFKATLACAQPPDQNFVRTFQHPTVPTLVFTERRTKRFDRRRAVAAGISDSKLIECAAPRPYWLFATRKQQLTNDL